MRLFSKSNVMKFKLLVSSVLFVVALMAGQSDARAQCDCIGQTSEIRGSRYSTAVDELDHSEVVFIGEVIETRNVAKTPNSSSEKTHEQEVRFKIQRAWKRAVDEYVIVIDNVDNCSIGFEKGDRYLVYAVADGSQLRTWYCSRTRLVARAKKDLDEFKSNGLRPIEIKRVVAPKP
jgi:hypothetical protein